MRASSGRGASRRACLLVLPYTRAHYPVVRVWVCFGSLGDLRQPPVIRKERAKGVTYSLFNNLFVSLFFPAGLSRTTDRTRPISWKSTTTVVMDSSVGTRGVPRAFHALRPSRRRAAAEEDRGRVNGGKGTPNRTWKWGAEEGVEKGRRWVTHLTATLSRGNGEQLEPTVHGHVQGRPSPSLPPPLPLL